MKATFILCIFFLSIGFSGYCFPTGRLAIFHQNKQYNNTTNQTQNSHLLMYIEGKSVRALVCSELLNNNNKSTFVLGSINNLTINGLRNEVKFSGGGDKAIITQSTAISIDLTSDSSILIVRYPDSTQVQYEQFAEYNNRISFRFNKGSGNVRERPEVTSKILTKVNAQTSGIEMLEIGPYSRFGQLMDFWYKIRVDGKEGWIFGGLEITER